MSGRIHSLVEEADDCYRVLVHCVVDDVMGNVKAAHSGTEIVANPSQVRVYEQFARGGRKPLGVRNLLRFTPLLERIGEQRPKVLVCVRGKLEFTA